jgi:hypothetical protein
MSEEACKKMSESHKGLKPSQEALQKRSDAMKRHFENPEARAAHSAVLKGLPSPKRKSCTIDGITIFESLKALTLELGFGKDGARHPNFRYL